MASVLLGDHLGLNGPVARVGHDTGMMVAYIVAGSYPKSVDKLGMVEAPLPGTAARDALVATPKLRNAAMWHFFHNADEDRAALAEAGELKMPVLAPGGASRFFIPIAEAMLRDVTSDVQVGEVPRCGHRIAEENPAALFADLSHSLG